MCDELVCIDVARCDCSEHGSCSTINGSCSCEAGWEGPICNDSVATTVVASTSNTGGDSESENRTAYGTVTLPSTSESPSPAHPTSKASAPPSSTSTEGKESSIACDASLRTLSVAVVIGTGIVSVIAHLLVCWYCQRRYYASHQHSMSHHRTRQPPNRRKRRKLRKKPAFMQIPLQSSSDCSI